MKQKRFPNGFTSWQEPHYEIVVALSHHRSQDRLSPKLEEIQQSRGRCGFWEVAEELTDRFEAMNLHRQWDGEFFDEVDMFVDTWVNN